MVRICLKQYPSSTVKKLDGPFKILKRINSNTYVVDLSSLSINIEDLVACKGPIFFSDKLLLNKPSLEPTFHRLFLPPLPQRKFNDTAE